MLQMLHMLGGKGASRGGEGQLAAKAQRLQRALERARDQRRDVRPAFMLMRKAEEAARSGNREAAGRYLDQALAAVKRAPRGGPDLRGRGLGRGRGGQNPMAPFVRALLGVMGAEEANLRVVADELLGARSVLLSSKPPAEQPQELKPMIDKAMAELQVVADRRKELQRQMQASRRRGGKPPAAGAARPPGLGAPGRPAMGRMTPEERRGMLRIVRDRLTLVLDRVRAMKDEEYARDKQLVLREILQAVFTPPTAEEQARLSAPPLPADPAERIRAKMLEASPVLRQWELQGKDTQHVEELLAQVRKDLYGGKLPEAEAGVDEALSLLGIAVGPAAARPGAGPSSDTGDAPEIDLPAARLLAERVPSSCPVVTSVRATCADGSVTFPLLATVTPTVVLLFAEMLAAVVRLVDAKSWTPGTTTVKLRLSLRIAAAQLPPPA